MTDQRPDVVERMEDITAAGTPGQGLAVPGAEPRGEIGDGGLGGEAPVDQFQQPHAPGLGVAMLLQAEQEAEGRGGIDPHQDRIARLEDLVEQADADGGEVVPLIDPPGLSDGAVHDVVHGPQGDPKSKRSRSNSTTRGTSYGRSAPSPGPVAAAKPW